jgi:two-component sensor histidine kinase
MGRDAAAESVDLSRRRTSAVLEGAGICLFSQDRDLRYVSVAGALGDLDAARLIGHTDDEIGCPPGDPAGIAAKHRVLVGGAPVDCEVSYAFGQRRALFALHIEPVFGPNGSIEGIDGVAVEITERKESEAHLHLLLREITHRSKNLLAIIQAMARQTARHSGNMGDFLARFSARIQALAQSHDLLVQQGWHGASLSELIRSQLAHFLDRDGSQVSIEGPPVTFKPEAAQALGLALHELATNAATHGSLSVSAGKLSIVWRYRAEGGVEIVWTESGGPLVGTRHPAGFGLLVIERNLTRALEAAVELDFRREGLHCRIAVPNSQLLDAW